VESNILDYAKIRLSWAQAGKSGDPYNTVGYYTLNSNNYQGQPLASFTNKITDANLKNELKTSYEAGADVRLFQSRVMIDFTWYHSVTNNQIMPITVSNATGYTTKLTNSGAIENKGVELMLSAVPIKTASGLKWTISFNFAKNNNKVLELIDGVDELIVGSDRNIVITAVPDKPFGVINAAGYAYLKDDNGNKLIDPSGLPVVQTIKTMELGNANPDWLGGLSNTIAFKGFTFSSLIDIRQGGLIFSQGAVQEAAYGTSKRTLEGREGDLLVEGIKAHKEGTTWVSDNVPNDVTTTAQAYWNRVAADKGLAVAEEFVYDASYIAIRYVRLAYQLPATLVSKIKYVNGISIAVYGRNLGYIERHTDGFSPENASNNVNAGTMGMEQHSLPMMRTFGFDFNITF